MTWSLATSTSSTSCSARKRLGYLCAVEFVERNGFVWQPPAGDGPGGEETVTVIQALAAGDIDEAEFAQWVAQRVRMP